jgi:hypothetical protein
MEQMDRTGITREQKEENAELGTQSGGTVYTEQATKERE